MLGMTPAVTSACIAAASSLPETSGTVADCGVGGAACVVVPVDVVVDVVVLGVVAAAVVVCAELCDGAATVSATVLPWWACELDAGA